MSFTRPLLRATQVRATIRPTNTIHHQRRTYATDSPPDPSKGASGSQTWIAIAAVLGIPAAYYLMSGPSSSPQKPRPSEVDKPASRKAPADDGNMRSMSAKQEGLDNQDSGHPYINEPGKSVKGEGETETTKLKGTIDPRRPQQ
ncbi:hypothetical protein BDW69DRAFT_176290 [Aspergillus filifer]